MKREAPSNWLGHPAFRADREAIRMWLIRSLLKSSGIWGSGLDTLLARLRDVIRESHAAFPTDELERSMGAIGKSLSFGPEEVEDLLDIEYGDSRRLFPLLSFLYPFIDTRQQHHIDHFFPKSRLTRRALERVGCDPSLSDKCQAARDKLPNLQLLEGLLNTSKNDSLPGEWLLTAYRDEHQRRAVLDRHDLGSAPNTPSEFIAFFEARRELLRSRLTTMLVRRPEVAANAAATSHASA